MKPTELALFVVLAAALFALYLYRKSRQNPKILANTPVPAKAENDKVIVIRNISYMDIQKAIRQFCKMYAGDAEPIIVAMTQLSDSVVAVTFPYDLSFDYFCFLVNYLHYPENIFYNGEIKAWATLRERDDGTPGVIRGKKIMLFIPADDKEYDNVHFVTSEGTHYKFGFANSAPSAFSGSSRWAYEECTISTEQLTGMPVEEIR